MTTKTDEVAAATATADQGPPAPLWAVLLELAGVAVLEKMPAPERVEVDRVMAAREPLLQLEFARADDAARWCDWFGVEYCRVASKTGLNLDAIVSGRSRVWRGYAIQIVSRCGPRRHATEEG